MNSPHDIDRNSERMLVPTKRILSLIVVAQLVYALSATAGCKTAACQQAVSWKTGYTAIVLPENMSREDYFAVLNALKANKAVVAIETEQVLLGWVPASVAAKLRGSVRAILNGPVDHPENLVTREASVAALTFFNRVQTGEFEDEIEAGLASPGEPLTGCVVTTSRAKTAAVHSESIDGPLGRDRDGLFSFLVSDDAAKSWQHIPPVVPNWGFQQPFQNPDMRGRVTVQVFRLDSDGTIDPDLYSWTRDDKILSTTQVMGAFTFWVDQAAARGVTLSFRPVFIDGESRYCRCPFVTTTHYEPIIHSSNDEYLWINDALTPYGYGSSPVTHDNVFNQNDAFNRDRKVADFYGPFDRSYSVYIVYNPSPAPSTFANGKRAHAELDGPFVMMMWNSAGWGPNNIGLVLSHETGHIFWACDEYYDAADNTGCFTCNLCIGGNSAPRYNVPNRNCEYPVGSCLVPRVDCMMRNQTYALCPDTPTQIGW